MRSWQTCLTLLGWGTVLAVLGADRHAQTLVAFVVVAVWAISTIALLRIPQIRGRNAAVSVSWLGPLLVLLSGSFPVLTAPATFDTANAVIQVLITATGFTWFFTLGMLPIFAGVMLIRPGMRCPVFNETEHVPHHYWWIPVLILLVFHLMRLFLMWSSVNNVVHLVK